ncbi:MAG: Maf family nucleotide pyrophosphatase, partial [Candidatus Omnitrophota bacterium]
LFGIWCLGFGIYSWDFRMNNLKIYLASKSPQRRQILRSLGIKFTVLPVGIKEKRSGRNCAQIVKDNALAKARQAAKKLKRGIVIAADTAVCSQGRIWGKPRHLKAARRILKALAQKPQMVYTGVAVKDVVKKKTVCAVEKTKVYMDKLSDTEVAAYFRKVSPLDKAGSFDIQGRGSIFIRRIEGCFYNVVGLPVARLYKLLKKLGVSLLLALFAVAFSGCYTEYNIATEKQETFLYGTEKEVNLGNSFSRAFEKEYKPVSDTAAQERVRAIGERIAAVCDRKELIYYFKVVDNKEVNAVSLPGGYVYIFQGLLDKVKNDDELAGVIAHEVGHIVARHAMKKLEALWGYTFLSVLAASADPGLGQGVQEAFVQIFMGYSQDDENLADKLAVKYTRKAGYDPNSMLDFLETLSEVHRKEPIRPYSYLRTHPYIAQRIAVVRQEITGKLEFRDYLNLNK